MEELQNCAGSISLNNITQVSTCTALSFDLAFAMTVHKAQGRTLVKMVIPVAVLSCLNKNTANAVCIYFWECHRYHAAKTYSC